MVKVKATIPAASEVAYMPVAASTPPPELSSLSGEMKLSLGDHNYNQYARNVFFF